MGKPASVLAIGLALAALAACGSGGGDDEGDTVTGNPTQAVCPDGGTALTYEDFGSAFMASYCQRCHSAEVDGSARNGAPDDHNFDTQVECQALADHIDELAGSGPGATNVEMPPSQPRPTLAERRMLSEWLACGAP